MLDFFGWLASRLSPLPQALLHLSLLYALHADEDLDVEAIARRIQANEKLLTKTMSLAEKLIMKGEMKGRQEGELKGTWKGQLLFLERLMGRPATPEAEIAGLVAAALEARFQALEAEYNSTFKPR